MDVYYTQYEFVAGRKYLIGFSTAVMGLGLIEIITSLVALNDTSGHYIGGWYLGMMCTIAGIRGSRLYGRNALNWLVVLTGIAWVVSIVGAAMQAENYKFLASLEACSSYSYGSDNTCGFTTTFNSTGYTCTGNEDYFPAAYACEINWVVTDAYDTDNQCSCVNSKTPGDCHDFSDMNSCSNLLNKAPKAVRACFAIAVLCTIGCTALMTVALISLRKPTLLATEEEIEEGERQIRERNQAVPEIAAAVVVINPAHQTSDGYTLNPTEVIIIQPGSNGQYDSHEYGHTATGLHHAPTVVQGTIVTDYPKNKGGNMA